LFILRQEKNNAKQKKSIKNNSRKGNERFVGSDESQKFKKKVE
jgi:hypothetical protein